MLDIIFQWLRTGSNPPDINLFWSDTGGKLLDWKILIPFFLFSSCQVHGERRYWWSCRWWRWGARGSRRALNSFRSYFFFVLRRSSMQPAVPPCAPLNCFGGFCSYYLVDFSSRILILFHGDLNGHKFLIY